MMVESGLKCSRESALAKASGAARKGAAGVGAGAAPPVPSPRANTSSTAPSVGNDGSGAILCIEWIGRMKIKFHTYKNSV